MQKETALWDSYASVYSAKVFYLTKYERVRKKILQSMQRGLTLDLGCGPYGDLLKDTSHCGDIAIGVDVSSKMLEKAADFCKNTLIQSDARHLPFKNEIFNSVVSVNSILPAERKDVISMLSEIYRILVPTGHFVAYLPSFEYALRAITYSRTDMQYDKENYRVQDTGSWQCFYTFEIIVDLLNRLGYKKIKTLKEIFDEKEELDDAKRIYGFDFAEVPIEEFFVVAVK